MKPTEEESDCRRDFCSLLGPLPGNGTRSPEEIAVALTYVYKHYAPDMTRYCISKGMQKMDAEDIVFSLLENEFQTVLTTFDCTLDCTFCEGLAVQSWLYKALYIKMQVYFSAPETTDTVSWDFEEIALEDETAVEALENIEINDSAVASDEVILSPDDAIRDAELFYEDSKREIDRVLYKAIRDLPKRERQYVIARYFHGAESSTEVADLLGISTGNARQIKHRLLNRLAQVEELICLIGEHSKRQS